MSKQKCIDYIEKWPLLVSFLYNLYIFGIHLEIILYPKLSYNEQCYKEVYVSYDYLLLVVSFFFTNVVKWMYVEEKKKTSTGTTNQPKEKEVSTSFLPALPVCNAAHPPILAALSHTHLFWQHCRTPTYSGSTVAHPPILAALSHTHLFWQHCRTPTYSGSTVAHSYEVYHIFLLQF